MSAAKILSLALQRFGLAKPQRAGGVETPEWSDVVDRIRSSKGLSEPSETVAIIREAEARLGSPVPPKLLIALARAEFSLGHLEAANAAITSAVEALPESSRALAIKTMIASAGGERDVALASCKAALDIEPGRPGLWRRYGELQREAGNPEAAEAAFRKGLEIDPSDPGLVQDFVAYLFHARRLKEAAEVLDAAHEAADQNWWIESKSKALRIQGHLNEAQLLLKSAAAPFGDALVVEHARVLTAGGHFQEALKLLEELPETPEALEESWEDRYWLLLALGRLDEAWALAGLRKKRSRISLPEHTSLWSPGERFESQPLILAEQGVGDELKFATCYPDLLRDAPDAKITCHPPLLPLFERSFPSVSFVPVARFSAAQRRDFALVDERGQAELNSARQCGLSADLVRHYRHTLASFAPGDPFLVPSPELRSKWRERLDALGPGPKVGLSWTTLGPNPERIPRYGALDDWLPVLATPGLTFVNLQHGARADDLDLAAAQGTPLHVWNDFDVKNDLDDLAALMAELDLVISAHSMTKELAGAVGACTWLVYHAADPQLAWRRREDGRDLWFNSIEHIVDHVPISVATAIAAVRERLTRTFATPKAQ